VRGGPNEKKPSPSDENGEKTLFKRTWKPSRVREGAGGKKRDWGKKKNKIGKERWRTRCHKTRPTQTRNGEREKRSE